MRHNVCVAAQKSLQKHHKKLNIMQIDKITIVPQDQQINGRSELEEIRMQLEQRFNAKIYFETSGETVADVIFEKELKQVIKK